MKLVVVLRPNEKLRLAVLENEGVYAPGPGTIFLNFDSSISMRGLSEIFGPSTIYIDYLISIC